MEYVVPSILTALPWAPGPLWADGVGYRCRSHGLHWKLTLEERDGEAARPAHRADADILFQVCYSRPGFPQAAVFCGLTYTSVIGYMPFGAAVTGRAMSPMSHAVTLPLERHHMVKHEQDVPLVSVVCPSPPLLVSSCQWALEEPHSLLLSKMPCLETPPPQFL